MADEHRCDGTNEDGTPCRARPGAGSRYCFFHDPNKEQERHEARQRGGRNRNRPPPVLPPEAADLSLATPEDVLAALVLTCNQLRKGEIDARTANALGYLISVTLKCREHIDVAEQVKQLKRRLDEPGVKLVS